MQGNRKVMLYAITMTATLFPSVGSYSSRESGYTLCGD